MTDFSIELPTDLLRAAMLRRILNHPATQIVEDVIGVIALFALLIVGLWVTP